MTLHILNRGYSIIIIKIMMDVYNESNIKIYNYNTIFRVARHVGYSL